ncbi:Uncharacterised protein [Chlamydia trachomatis]|nr:Uncharacterised protein [Chlamydia trachomatis]
MNIYHHNPILGIGFLNNIMVKYALSKNCQLAVIMNEIIINNITQIMKMANPSTYNLTIKSFALVCSLSSSPSFFSCCCLAEIALSLIMACPNANILGNK